MPTTINPSDQTITQYNIQTGGANNLLNNVAPSATSGVPVISQGASAQPIFGTTAIAGGGTNATSMSTSTGIVKYDGTSLVTSSTAKIDSSNRQTNTAQPCFSAIKSSSSTNQTGNAALVTVVFDTVVFDNNSNYANGTGIFTAPVTGRYFFNTAVDMTNCTIGTIFTLFFIGTSRNFELSFTRAASAAQYQMIGSCILDMTAGDTCKIQVQTYGEAGNTQTVFGQASNYLTYFSGHLIC